MSRWPPESPAGVYQRLANQCRANARVWYQMGEPGLGLIEDTLASTYQALVEDNVPKPVGTRVIHGDCPMCGEMLAAPPFDVDPAGPRCKCWVIQRSPSCCAKCADNYNPRAIPLHRGCDCRVVGSCTATGYPSSG